MQNFKVGDIVRSEIFAEPEADHEIIDIKGDDATCRRCHDGQIQWCILASNVNNPVYKVEKKPKMDVAKFYALTGAMWEVYLEDVGLGKIVLTMKDIQTMLVLLDLAMKRAGEPTK